jgi:vesicular inhibitory amino acid transporter
VSEESNRDEEDAESCGEASVCEEDLEPVPSEYASLCPTFSRSNYGSTQSFSRVVMPPEGLSDSVTRHAVDPFSEQQQANQGGSPTDKERQPLLVKTVATDQGRVQKIIVGQSTLPQTVFNSVNILIGVGVLSLPLGLKYSGWYVE